MASTFNPFELDKPVLNLGEHGSYTLGDITESRQKRLTAIGERLEALQVDDATEAEPFVELVADLAEAACENADGLGAKIVQLYADDEIGAKALQGLSEFIGEWIAGEQSAGEA